MGADAVDHGVVRRADALLRELGIDAGVHGRAVARHELHVDARLVEEADAVVHVPAALHAKQPVDAGCEVAGSERGVGGVDQLVDLGE